MYASFSKILLKDLKPRIRKAIAKVLSRRNLDWKDLLLYAHFPGITAQISGGHISPRSVTLCSQMTLLFLLTNKMGHVLNWVLISKSFQGIRNWYQNKSSWHCMFYNLFPLHSLVQSQGSNGGTACCAYRRDRNDSIGSNHHREIHKSSPLILWK